MKINKDKTEPEELLFLIYWISLGYLPACYVVKYVSDFVPVFWLTTKTFEIFTEINVILYDDDFRREAVHRENQGRIRLRSVFPASTELNSQLSN